MRRTLSLKQTLLAVLLVMVVSSPLAACGELAPYPVKDSGLLASDLAYVIWLDNTRVLFNGYTGVEYATDDPNKITRSRDAGYYCKLPGQGDTGNGELRASS
jgi:hypothetical protein